MVPKRVEEMGRPKSDPKPSPPTHAAQAPPQGPQEEAPQKFSPAGASCGAAPQPPTQQQQPYQHPKTEAFHGQPQPLPQPSQAQFLAAPFPPQQPPAQPHVATSQSCQYIPTGYPSSGQQQFNQYSAPVQGTPHGQVPPARYGIWTTGLFGCFEDPANALITLCFPCVPFGQVAEILDNGQTSCAISAIMYTAVAYFLGLPCILSCTYRSKLRGMYGLPETPAPDWIVHLFCESCAICQEYRELQNRGINPSIGWHSNMALQQQQMAAMAPPVNQAMRF